MRNILILASLVMLAACTGRRDRQTVDGEPVQVRVAAYNVEYSKNATATEIGKALSPFNFDIVCFSEAPGGGWTEQAAAAMGMEYSQTGRYSTAGHEDKYKTIASRTPLFDPEEVLMADTLHTATKAKTIINGVEIAVYAVHFPFGWRDQAHIDETTHKIVTFIDYLRAKQTEETAVVAGDFNFIPSSAEKKNMYHERFMEAGMDVAWKALGIDCTKLNTWNALDSTHTGNGEVIDHIMYLTDRMKAIDGGIIEMENPLSDHKPVWAALQLINTNK